MCIQKMTATSCCTVFFCSVFFCYYRCFSKTFISRKPHSARIKDTSARFQGRQNVLKLGAFIHTSDQIHFCCIILFNHQLRTFKWPFGLRQTLFQWHLSPSGSWSTISRRLASYEPVHMSLVLLKVSSSSKGRVVFFVCFFLSLLPIRGSDSEQQCQRSWRLEKVRISRGSSPRAASWLQQLVPASLLGCVNSQVCQRQFHVCLQRRNSASPGVEPDWRERWWSTGTTSGERFHAAASGRTYGRHVQWL